LSYTSFSYSDIALSKPVIKSTDKLVVKCTVTNTGNYDGEETVQLYIRDLVGSIVRPVKELKDFKKIQLKKGVSTTVEFTLTANDLRFYNDKLQYIFEPGDFKVFVGGSSASVKEAGFALVK
jgi:beta-glucosidase